MTYKVSKWFRGVGGGVQGVRVGRRQGVFVELDGGRACRASSRRPTSRSSLCSKSAAACSTSGQPRRSWMERDHGSH